MEEELDKRRDFLRSEILDQNYDVDEFLLYLKSIKGEDAADLEIWTWDELITVKKQT